MATRPDPSGREIAVKVAWIVLVTIIGFLAVADLHQKSARDDAETRAFIERNGL